MPRACLALLVPCYRQLHRWYLLVVREVEELRRGLGKAHEIVGAFFDGLGLLAHDLRGVRALLNGLVYGVADLTREVLDLCDGALGVLRELADLLGDDAEAGACRAGARGLDGGVEAEELRLFRDVLDEAR